MAEASRGPVGRCGCPLGAVCRCGRSSAEVTGEARERLGRQLYNTLDTDPESPTWESLAPYWREQCRAAAEAIYRQGYEAGRRGVGEG